MLDLWANLPDREGDFKTLCMQMSLKTPLDKSKLIEICRRPVPQDMAARARFSLLDWIGCSLAARHAPAATSMALARAEATGGTDSDLWSIGVLSAQTDAQGAALAFGTLGNVLEMDDLHRAAILHPGNTTCAAALGVGLHNSTSNPTSGTTLLNAIVRGYEAAIRIGTAAAAGGYAPFYNSGTCGIFGAAIACADLKGLDADAMADALGQAGMQAAGIWQCRLEPTFSKQLACAHAARAGVFSAELAAVGFRGARAILTGEFGFFASYYPRADRSALTAPGDWAITQMSFKPFAACRHTHPAISACLGIRQENTNINVESIDIYTYHSALDFCNAPAPTTPDAARFSLQHAVATTWLRGAPAISDFEGSALKDPEIMALRSRVSLHRDANCDAAFPQAYGARVCVTLRDGRTRSAECPAAWGDPENPMSQADLIAKFRANAAHGDVDPRRASAIIEAVLKLPDAKDLTALNAALEATLTLKPEFV